MIKVALGLCILSLPLIFATLWFEFVTMPKYVKKGIYPRTGEGTIESVKRLKATGHPELAMRLYRQLKNCSLRDAKAAVATLSTDN